MVLHISAYSIRCLSSPFCTVFRRDVIRARVNDEILDLSGLLIALVSLHAFYWIVSVMVLLMVSMSFSSCVLNQFLNSSWNSIFFDSIWAASILGLLLVINVFFYTSTSNLIMWSLPMFTLLMNVTLVTMSGLCVRM